VILRRLPAVLAAALCLGLAAPAVARDAALLHLPRRLPAPRARLLEQALTAALRGREGRILPLEAARAALTADAPARASRRRAARLLADAMGHVRGVRYERATRVLSAARVQARQGLAQLLDPKLLAEIDFQHGSVLHVMRSPRARQLLQRSFALWPRRTIDEVGGSPKVVRAQQQAAVRARRAPPPRLSTGTARRAAALLGCGRLVLITPLEVSEGLEIVEASLFSRERGAWAARRRQVWPASASREEIASRLARVLDALVGREEAPPRPAPRAAPARQRGRGRRIAAWVTTAGAVALAAAGAALFAVSEQRIGEAEDLVTSPPTAEYADEAQGLEAAARRLRAGAIATAAAAGAAAAAALLLWIWEGDDGGEERRAAPVVSASGAGLVLRF
jgi:hypothetical protein